jgi:hypothetical protein
MSRKQEKKMKNKNDKKKFCRTSEKKSRLNKQVLCVVLHCRKVNSGVVWQRSNELNKNFPHLRRRSQSLFHITNICM